MQCYRKHHTIHDCYLIGCSVARHKILSLYLSIHVHIHFAINRLVISSMLVQQQCLAVVWCLLILRI